MRNIVTHTWTARIILSTLTLILVISLVRLNQPWERTDSGEYREIQSIADIGGFRQAGILGRMYSVEVEGHQIRSDNDDYDEVDEDDEEEEDEDDDAVDDNDND